MPPYGGNGGEGVKPLSSCFRPRDGDKYYSTCLLHSPGILININCNYYNMKSDHDVFI